MKSIVMTAQDARELDKLGGLTIAKPIKPALAYIEGARLVTHAPGQWLLLEPDGDRLGAEIAGDFFTPPVQTGDAVFIREPWYRLKTPSGDDSDRVILASDTDAEPVAYKWASPVSMPEDAARRFARVSSVTPIYNENVTAWEITLEKIDKAEAVAVDAGLPYSSAIDEEGRSDYFTLGADMTAEDHEKMVADIDADRARLEAIRSRRREIAIRLGSGAPSLGEGEALVDEEATLAREEAEIVAALEDAHVPTENHLPPAEEIRKKAATLKEQSNEVTAEEAESLGFKAVSDDAVELLGLVVEMIARGPISSASLNIRGQCKAKCSITSKGKIKVSRSETRSCDLEAGE